MQWLFLAYPLLSHLAVLTQEPWIEWLALLMLCVVALFEPLRRGSLPAWLSLAVLSVGLYFVVMAGDGRFAMYLPPVLIPAALLVVFGRTLKAGSMPLVTRIATAVRGPLPADLAAYTRQVTIGWSLLFVALILSGILCAAFAPPALWSLMTNFVHYAVLGAAFLSEYAYRRWRFRHYGHESFFEHIRALARTNYRTL